MRRKYSEHITSILFFAVLFLIIGLIFTPAPHSSKNSFYEISELQFIDGGQPLQKLILKESLDLYYPDQTARNDSILNFISQGSENNFFKTSDNKYLTQKKVWQILYMYFKFVIIYIIVLVLTYYGAQSFATLKFVKMKHGRSSYLVLVLEHLRSGDRISVKELTLLIFKAGAKGIVYLILFSPAYVIAYSFKTRFDTDSVFFMVILGILSNGLLISYTQKFYTFLTTESRKGYVNTARVKNLNNNYNIKTTGGITLGKIFRLRKRFKGHVFQHIYKNAQFQFISSLKEQASFLISGLVIIEMALNIQGHLCYELLQNILYQNLPVILLIIFLIFLLLKVTEIYSDFLQQHYANKYENITS